MYLQFHMLHNLLEIIIFLTEKGRCIFHKSKINMVTSNFDDSLLIILKDRRLKVTNHTWLWYHTSEVQDFSKRLNGKGYAHVTETTNSTIVWFEQS